MKETREIFIQNNWAKHDLEISANIIHDMATSVSKSFGPVGASTLMVQAVGDNPNKNAFTASVTKDGYTIISKLNYFHPAAVALKRLLLESMLSVLSTAGDGTTSTTILIDNMVHKYLEDSDFFEKYPAQVIVNTGKRLVAKLSEAMRELGSKSGETTTTDIHNIINTTVNGDEELRTVVTDVVNELSDNGNRPLDDVSITYLPSPNGKTSYKIESGYVIPRATSFEAHTGNRKEKARVILINRSLSTADEFRGLVAFIKSIVNNSIKVCGGDLSKIQKTLLVTYNINNKEVLEDEIKKIRHAYQMQFNVTDFPVSILIYGEDGTVQGRDEHEDFEYLLGQTVAYDVTLGAKLESLFVDEMPEDIPFSKDSLISEYVTFLCETEQVTTATIEYNKTSTIISEINPIIANSKEILIERLEDELAEAKEADKFFIRKRITKIDGKFATIEVGGDNEWDIKRKQDAIDDVVGAIRLASKSPVCGGLSSLILKTVGCISYEPVNKLEAKLLELITSAYKRLVEQLLNSCKMDTSLIEDVIKSFQDCKTNNIQSFIRQSYDIRKYIDILTNTDNEVYANDIISYEILNTVEAEVKILEASVNAMLTLVSINQIALPDQYDASSYKNANL